MTGVAGVATGEHRSLRLVCAYPDGSLRADWFQAYRRLKRTLRRGGYDATVELLPDIAIPGEEAILIVPPELEGTLAGAAGGEVVVMDPDAAQVVIDQLVERLAASGTLRRGPPPGRTTAVHRGFQAVLERARLAD